MGDEQEASPSGARQAVELNEKRAAMRRESKENLGGRGRQQVARSGSLGLRAAREGEVGPARGGDRVARVVPDVKKNTQYQWLGGRFLLAACTRLAPCPRNLSVV